MPATASVTSASSNTASGLAAPKNLPIPATALRLSPHAVQAKSVEKTKKSFAEARTIVRVDGAGDEEGEKSEGVVLEEHSRWSVGSF